MKTRRLITIFVHAVSLWCGMINGIAQVAAPIPSETSLDTMAKMGSAANPVVAIAIAVYQADSEAKWRAETNQKLDQLLGYSQQILEEVRALGPKMDLAVEKGLLEQSTKNFQASATSLRVFLEAKEVNPRDSNIQHGINTLLPTLTRDAFITLQFEEGSYHASILAYSTLVTAQKTLGWNEEQIKPGREKFLEAFQRWLDPNRPTSFVAMKSNLIVKKHETQKAGQKIIDMHPIAATYMGNGVIDPQLENRLAISNFFRSFVIRANASTEPTTNVLVFRKPPDHILNWESNAFKHHFDRFGRSKDILIKLDLDGTIREEFSWRPAQLLYSCMPTYGGGIGQIPRDGFCGYFEIVPDKIAEQINWKSLPYYPHLPIASKKQQLAGASEALKRADAQIASLDKVISALEQVSKAHIKKD